MKNFTSGLKIVIIPALCLFLSGYKPVSKVADMAGSIQEVLNRHYDKDRETGVLKKYELNVTNNGFCRYKKYHTNGKIEFFSFNITRFKNVDYIGSVSAGRLHLKTESDDVIVQTYNAKGGDIDSIGTEMILPLKNIDVEELNKLADNLATLKKALIK
ncbi:MAG: hypothetical protein EOO89_23380 [Pedobacter sp.]|nr:MAG: hypothetical protein EOO89_23380 [Pedobacter sp.]